MWPKWAKWASWWQHMSQSSSTRPWTRWPVISLGRCRTASAPIVKPFKLLVSLETNINNFRLYFSSVNHAINMFKRWVAWSLCKCKCVTLFEIDPCSAPPAQPPPTPPTCNVFIYLVFVQSSYWSLHSDKSTQQSSVIIDQLTDWSFDSSNVL